MGFLNFWRNEKKLESNSPQQLDLFQKPELAKRERSTGITIFRKFTSSIQANGGDQDAIIDSIVTETQELFDCSVSDLYQETGATPNDRSTLPEIVQRSYIANEALASFELEQQEGSLGGESQTEVNRKIVDSVKDTSRQTRRWLPW